MEFDGDVFNYLKLQKDFKSGSEFTCISEKFNIDDAFFMEFPNGYKINTKYFISICDELELKYKLSHVTVEPSWIWKLAFNTKPRIVKTIEVYY